MIRRGIRSNLRWGKTSKFKRSKCSRNSQLHLTRCLPISRTRCPRSRQKRSTHPHCTCPPKSMIASSTQSGQGWAKVHKDGPKKVKNLMCLWTCQLTRWKRMPPTHSAMSTPTLTFPLSLQSTTWRTHSDKKLRRRKRIKRLTRSPPFRQMTSHPRYTRTTVSPGPIMVRTAWASFKHSKRRSTSLPRN